MAALMTEPSSQVHITSPVNPREVRVLSSQHSHAPFGGVNDVNTRAGLAEKLFTFADCEAPPSLADAVLFLGLKPADWAVKLLTGDGHVVEIARCTTHAFAETVAQGLAAVSSTGLQVSKIEPVRRTEGSHGRW